MAADAVRGHPSRRPLRGLLRMRSGDEDCPVHAPMTMWSCRLANWARTHERHPGKAGSAARERAARRRAGAHRCAAQARQADRARARRTADGQGLLRGVRHVRRAPRDRFRHGQGAEDAGRRRGDRLGHGERPHGVRLRQGLHRVRRLALGDARAEDPEDPGHGDEGARADRRPVRCRRRAHPGGRCLARRLRRGVQAQRDRVAA